MMALCLAAGAHPLARSGSAAIGLAFSAGGSTLTWSVKSAPSAITSPMPPLAQLVACLQQQGAITPQALDAGGNSRA
jgi:hypothetical protein